MKYLRYLFFAIIFLFLAVPASADTLGQNQSFFISPQYDAKSRAQVSTTLRNVSDSAYFYVEDGYWNSISPDTRSQVLNWIASLGREFDSRIYPIETQFFGSEPNPGIDNNPRITILLSPLIENAGGYFDTANGYPKSQVPNSNGREMIYINVIALSDQRKINAFLAHEFQHLISFNQKEKLRNVTDDTWLNELRSEYAVTLLGYNDNFAGSHLEKRSQAFIQNPSDSLTEWKNTPADYGQIGLFGEYLAEHWSLQVIADTLKTSLVGMASINDALKQNGFSDSFLDVFSQWTAANILNDASINPKFGYARNGLQTFHIAPNKTFINLGDNIALATSDMVKDWQGRWYDVSQFANGGKSVLKINFSSPSVASFYVSYLVLKNDGSQVLSVFNPAISSSTLYVSGIGTDVKRVILMPIKRDKISGFTSDETVMLLALSVERTAAIPQEAVATPTPSPSTPTPTIDAVNFPLPNIPNGSLIRADGDYKVYVVNGGWRRHIVNSKIFGFYPPRLGEAGPQFGFNKVKIISSSVLAQYRESDLIRYQAGTKVYSVDESGEKHWLDISAGQFSNSGRDWDSIFVVNLKELNFYPTSPSIVR
jgi:hypothetical protein